MGISPEYFLDEMSIDEIRMLLDQDDKNARQKWEMLRWQCFYTVSPYNDKIKSPKDLFKLPWDEKQKKVSKTPPQQAKQKANKLEKWLEKTKQA